MQIYKDNDIKKLMKQLELIKASLKNKTYNDNMIYTINKACNDYLNDLRIFEGNAVYSLAIDGKTMTVASTIENLQVAFSKYKKLAKDKPVTLKKFIRVTE